MIADYYPYFIQHTPVELCVAEGCRTPAFTLEPGAIAGPRLAVPETDLCQWHHGRFPRILNDLAALWPDLERALYAKSGGESNTKVHTSGIRDMAQVWNPHATEVMAEIADWTRFLTRLVLRDRPLPRAEITSWDETDTLYVNGAKRVITTRVDKIAEHTHGIALDIPVRLALAALAKHHARWLSQYPFLGPFLLADAQEHRYQAMQAIQSSPVRRVGLKNATCGHVVDQMGAQTFTCSATMVAILGHDDRPSTIVCAAHPKTHEQYSKTEWMAWA